MRLRALLLILISRVALSSSWATELPMDPLTEARARGALTLTDSFRAAAQLNERVALAQESLTQAELLKKNAISRVLPQLTLVDGYYRQNPVTVSNAGSVVTVSDARNELRVDLTQPIFHGLRDQSYIRYAKSNIQANRYQLDESRRLIYSDVAEAFYTALEHEGQIRAFEEAVAAERERYKEIEAWYEAGLARKTEVLLVKSTLDQDEANLARIRNLLSGSRQLLTFWITVPVDLPLQDDLVLPENPVPPVGGEGEAEVLKAMQMEARASRSDLRQQVQEVQSRQYQVSFARGEYLPTLDLDASAYLDRTNYSTYAQQTDWSALLLFTFPLYDGGRIRSNVMTAQSLLRQAELARDELARQVELEVKNAFLTLQSDLATLATLEASVQAADENCRLLLEEYRQGLASNLEVVTGQNQLLSARINLEHQKNQVRIDWVSLKLTQGLVPEGTPPDLWISPAPNPPEKSKS
jgi:outer membrane protein TolC